MPSFFDPRGLSNINSRNYSEFAVHETDESSDTRYYGYVNHAGYWIIMRQVRTTGVTRYAAGKGGTTAHSFATNWTNRASLTYKYINELQS